MCVLNLIITGIPSIPKLRTNMILIEEGFKPYYNWNTFNTLMSDLFGSGLIKVLNLIITGIPSIHRFRRRNYIFRQ